MRDIKPINIKSEIDRLEVQRFLLSGEEHHISDLYFLLNGTKQFLLLDKSCCIHSILNEAYQDNLFVKTDTETYKSKILVTILDNPKKTDIARHMISALIRNPEDTVNHIDNSDVGSIRTTLYRLKKDIPFDVMTGCSNGVVFIKKKNNADSNRIKEILDENPTGEIFEIPSHLYTDLSKLRARLQTYGVSNHCRVRTRMENDVLKVVKEPIDKTYRSGSDIAKHYLTKLPYDTPLPINYQLFGELPRNKVKVLLRNQSKNTVSIKGDVITKNRTRLIKQQGTYNLYCEGELIYSIECEKLGSVERSAINTILHQYGKVLVGNKIQVINRSPQL